MTPSILRIGILSANNKSYSTRRLLEAGRARGHKVRIYSPNEFSILVEENNPTLFYRDKLVKAMDAVVPRIGASITFFGTAVVRQFEQMGVYCANSSQAITVSRDKLRSIQVLSRHHVGIPKTAFVKSREVVIPAIELVGGAPVVIKLLEGTQGIGVMLAEHSKIAEAIVETLHTAKQNVLIQSFVQESRGRDIRAFVIGDRVVAAMRRIATGDEFRSNVHRGGRTEPVKLDREYERTAVRSAQVMGLRIAGVDILESNDGPKVMEVNSSPGLEGIEGATGVDVAGAIIEFVEHEVRFPEVDIRQRLTLHAGYAVAEVRVDEDSPFVGRSLGDCGLRDRDIAVISLSRGNEVIPIPRSECTIAVGDVMLCFGDMGELRTILPPIKKRKKKLKGTGKPDGSKPDEAKEPAEPASAESEKPRG